MDQHHKRNLSKFKIFLQLLLFILYVVWVALIVSKFEIDTLIRITSEGADFLQKVLLVCTIIGTALTSLYLMTINKDQASEQKNAKSLLGVPPAFRKKTTLRGHHIILRKLYAKRFIKVFGT